ncbi:hypothetical protein ACLIXB_003688 [Yersinia enterocolitica]|uniref:hypothetical protein n=1 Tax=Yersinia TaxID=629 RepID=UPI0005EA08D1|nr:MULTISPECIES: hypothetical protein [Yersinia]EKN3394627.1 hypothetical protein [Yersinia enterocolitica]EKN3636787.1 hypothetical protein [Yersinia enterocolitica]EKN3832837.1 hypothetical protein [Yersinia enterocolitica]EKN4883213.1 hypothetical protein [Yersinia enterocolitica]EKN6093434.1 hypothetical protein [Yersinia enterocolitica]
MAKISPIDAPDYLCIYHEKHREKTLLFLNDIDTRVIIEHKSVVIDLQNVIYASAAASLLFFAIVNRAQLLVGDKQVVRFIFPKKNLNTIGHRYIVSTGLSKALLANSADKLEELIDEDRYFQSGVNPNKHLQSTTLMLDKTAEFTFEQFYLLSMGIGEAMLNVSHHAYETVDEIDFSDQIKALGGRRWWQCAWFDKDKDKAVFIICDLGLGIAKSYTSLQQYSEIPDETFLVKEALSCGRSRFAGSGRGNGSEDIKRPVGEGCTQKETLLVLSGNSQYYYTSADTEPMCYRLKEHIPGTLVEWTLVPRRIAL